MGSQTTRLIINADDFGLSPGINQGVLRLFDNNRLTSTSLVVNMPSSTDAVEQALIRPAMRVGLHLNLTTGRPLLPPDRVASLVTDEGDFLSTSAFLLRLMTGRLDLNEVEAELGTQIETYLKTGLEPAHIDSHMHLHALPTVGNLVADLAESYGIGIMRNPDPLAFVFPTTSDPHPVQEAIRAPLAHLAQSTVRILGGNRQTRPKQFTCADRVIYLRWCLEAGSDALDTFQGCLRISQGSRVEVVTHPAVADDILPGLSRYVAGRETELEFLLSNEFSRLLAQDDISVD